MRKLDMVISHLLKKAVPQKSIDVRDEDPLGLLHLTHPEVIYNGQIFSVCNKHLLTYYF